MNQRRKGDNILNGIIVNFFRFRVWSYL